MQAAVVIMFVAMSCIPLGDAAGKLLTGSHGVDALFVAWSRFAVGALIILPFAPKGSFALLRDWRIWLRALFIMGGISFIQVALSTEPIANVFAAFFIGPIFSFVLSVVLLKEQTSPVRNLLMIIGFCGVLLVVRPGFGLTVGMGYALVAGMSFGAFLTTSKWLADLARPRALLMTQLVIPALLLAPIGVPRLPEITPEVGGLTLASAVFSLLGNLLLQIAYRRADGTAIAPFVYFQLFAATLIGWMLFDSLPDQLTWIGLTLVMGAGLASALLRRAPAPLRP